MEAHLMETLRPGLRRKSRRTWPHEYDDHIDELLNHHNHSHTMPTLETNPVVHLGSHILTDVDRQQNERVMATSYRLGTWNLPTTRNKQGGGITSESIGTWKTLT